ncbi:MAG: hypothetical protein KI792_05005 [Alphaproteobacteria bacterium]|nr:hypothetical protein [Alphaproteobacteria bacterium SS10]
MVSKLAPAHQDATGTRAANSNSRRARRLVQALAAGLAASPAAASPADVVEALNAPQARVIQVQSTDGATPPAATVPGEAQTPGQAGIACISMTSPSHAIGAFVGVTRDSITVRPMITAGPGVAPEAPEGLNCTSFEEFETAAHGRLTSFVNDTADFIEGIERQLGLPSGPTAPMRDPNFVADPENAYVQTTAVFRYVLSYVMQRVGEQNFNSVVSRSAHEALAARHVETGNELLMLQQLRGAMPQLQEQLDSGTLDANDGRRPVIIPDANAIPIRFESGPDSARVKAARDASLRVEAPRPERDRTAVFQI